MKFWVLAAISVLFLAGCVSLGEKPDKNLPIGFQPPEEKVQAGEESKSIDIEKIEYVPEEVPEPSEEMAGNGVNEGCSLLDGNEKVDCFFEKAREEKDVSICTGLETQEDRNSCIARWCLSEARDFRQCEGLGYDDRLGCLNKCNPNRNT